VFGFTPFYGNYIILLANIKLWIATLRWFLKTSLFGEENWYDRFILISEQEK